MTLTHDLASQIDYWNRVASEKRFSHPLKLEWLDQQLNTSAPILDCGCGYGRTLAELLKAGYRNVFGVDYSRAMLAHCRSNAPTARVVQNDGRSLPFSSNSFQAVFLFAVLTCIPADNDQLQLMNEIERVLLPGGLLYVSDLLVNFDERNRARYEQFSEAYGCYGVFELPEGVVVRHHSEERIQQITAAFSQLRFEPFEVTTMNGNVSKAFQYLGVKPGA